MKSRLLSRFLPALATGLMLAAPVSSMAKDKHHHHRDRCDSGRSSVYVSSGFGIGSPYGYGSYSRGYGGYSRPHYGGSYASSYCAPRYSTRPSIGFSLFSSPSYYSSSYRSSRYYPSSSSRYSTRASYSDELAVDVQRALRRGGYYYGDIDGDIGPESRAAIRDYQRDRGLPATGRIDSSLLRSLRIG